MGKIKYALIGSGWRAEFYIRIAKMLPEQFCLTAVLVRDSVKGAAFAEKFQVKVVNTLEELMEDEPNFVVLSIKRGTVTDYLMDLFERGIPVLAETPPEKIWIHYSVCGRPMKNISLKCRWLNNIFYSRCMHHGIRRLRTE